MLLGDERTAVVEVCQALRRDRLVVGTAGNVSVRAGGLVAISPSGVAYETLRPDEVGVHRLDGEPVDAPLRPSSELPLHLAIYRATAAAAIVHTHGVASTAVSTVLDELPASHYYTAMFGGPVRVSPYAAYGTEALAQSVVSALRDRRAAIMGNHGAVTVADTLSQAHALAEYLEYLCDVHLRALATGLPVRTLPLDEIAEVALRIAPDASTRPPGCPS
ncbi:MAG: class II aldolase/adducin family protein [Pseudonocardiales bacterium]|nr:class II aldolase/adducin family protein [Pseudonocardiales bacterium]